MNSDGDTTDMYSFHYFDKGRESSSSEESQRNEKNEMEVSDLDVELDEFKKFDNEFEVDEGYSIFQKRRMESGRGNGQLYNSLNYPKLRQNSDDDEEGEEEEEEEEEEGYNRNNRYPEQRNYSYGIGYGSPPEEEDEINRADGYSSGFSTDYSHGYAGYRGFAAKPDSSRYNGYSAAGYPNIEYPTEREDFNFHRSNNSISDNNVNIEIDDMPTIRTRPYYSSINRYSGYSGHSGYSESSLSGPSTPEPIRGKLSRQEGGRVGLRNLGNTCYLNSTLQCLTATIELSYRLAEEYEKDELPSSRFLIATARLFHEMWQSEGKSTSIGRSVMPTQFKSVLGQIDSRFSGYRQEDSQEALAIILDRLHEELKKTSDDNDDDKNFDLDGWEVYCKKENSLVRKLFHGQLKSTLRCCECSFKSETYEPFCFLNLPIPVNEPREYKSNNNKNKIVTVTSTASTTKSKFKILCFNDKIYNSESSYLIMNRSFKNLNEFRLFFRGAGVWIVEVEGNQVTGVKTKLPTVQELNSFQHAFIAFKAELLFKNHLVTFVAAKSGEVVGFPILIRTELNETLTPALFIKNFLNSTIRSILVNRFPERLKLFDSTISLMMASSNEYFKIEFIKNEPIDLIHVRVVILNDKSDFNEMIFFKEVDDPNDLFEELCIEVSEEDSEDEGECDVWGVGYNVDRAEDTADITHVTADVTATPADNPAESSVIPAQTSLKDCFDKLFSVENFNEWKCEKCGIPVRAEKSLELWRLPEILILHLKRFSYGSISHFAGYGGGAKISKAVDFPLQLEMKDHCKENGKYELFAISQHFGSLNFGHYTAILKHQPTGKWFLADDGSITVYEREEDWNNEKLKESAYVLFYRKINK